MNTKVILIFGGVYSSLGKGIISSSIGRILTEMKYKVSMLKCDPYLNVDPGTLSPYQHGEVFVTYDGAETDLDLGNYERFTGKKMSRMSTLTSGRVYSEIISKERAGGYEGKTVQVIPHVTDHIKNKIYKLIEAENPDFLLIEIGGTVGDIESIPFVEAMSQFTSEYGKDNVMSILCAPLIYIQTSEEIKTKPTQHSFKELCSLGITPSILILRYTQMVGQSIIDKIALSCHISSKNIFVSPNLKSTYFLPVELYNQGIYNSIMKYFGIKISPNANIDNWVKYTNRIKAIKDEVKIAIVGKYIELHDSYASLVESLKLAGYEYSRNVKIGWVNSDTLTSKNLKIKFDAYHGILIPGGFGIRGIEGKILAAQYARTSKTPYMGICLGMQIATIEFARNVLGWKDATSQEFNPKSKRQVFHYIDGRMRLGEQVCHLISKSTKCYKLYKNEFVAERHRHRYEFNNKYIKAFEDKGFVFSAFSNDSEKTVEMIELKDHPFFLGGQFHPELGSTPGNVDPMFIGFIGASIKHSQMRKNKK